MNRIWGVASNMAVSHQFVEPLMPYPQTNVYPFHSVMSQL